MEYKSVSTKSLSKKVIKNKSEPFRMKTEKELSKLVAGLIAVSEPVLDFDHKEEYHKHLEEKYGR